jgi:hypothetical protein
VSRQVVARFAGLDFPKSEYVLVERRGLVEIFDFQSQMDNAVHKNSVSDERE